jgi:hypothetical protein
MFRKAHAKGGGASYRPVRIDEPADGEQRDQPPPAPAPPPQPQPQQQQQQQPAAAAAQLPSTAARAPARAVAPPVPSLSFEAEDDGAAGSAAARVVTTQRAAPRRRMMAAYVPPDAGAADDSDGGDVRAAAMAGVERGDGRSAEASTRYSSDVLERLREATHGGRAGARAPSPAIAAEGAIPTAAEIHAAKEKRERMRAALQAAANGHASAGGASERRVASAVGGGADDFIPLGGGGGGKALAGRGRERRARATSPSSAHSSGSHTSVSSAELDFHGNREATRVAFAGVLPDATARRARAATGKRGGTSMGDANGDGGDGDGNGDGNGGGGGSGDDDDDDDDEQLAWEQTRLAHVRDQLHAAADGGARMPRMVKQAEIVPVRVVLTQLRELVAANRQHVDSVLERRSAHAAEKLSVAESIERTARAALADAERAGFFARMREFVIDVVDCVTTVAPAVEAACERAVASLAAVHTTLTAQRREDAFEALVGDAGADAAVSHGARSAFAGDGTADAAARAGALHVPADVARECEATLEGAADDFASLGGVVRRMAEWRTRFPKEYAQAFVEESLADLLAPYVQLELVRWRVWLRGEVSEHEWFQHLLSLCDADAADSAAPPLLRDCFRRLVAPYVGRVCAEVLDVWSASETRNVAAALGDILDIVGGESAAARQLHDSLLSRLRAETERAARWRNVLLARASALGELRARFVAEALVECVRSVVRAFAQLQRVLPEAVLRFVLLNKLAVETEQALGALAPEATSGLAASLTREWEACAGGARPAQGADAMDVSDGDAA